MGIKCKKCKVEYEREEFLTASGRKKYTACRECRRDEGRRRMRKRKVVDNEAVRSYLIEALGGKCTRCGFDGHVLILELQHLDRATGMLAIDRAISTFTYSGSIAAWDAVESQVARCIVLCPNCKKLLRLGHWRLEDVVGKAKRVSALSMIEW